MTRIAIAALVLLAVALAAVPAAAQHGGTYYNAHTYQGRYYPAGVYTIQNGCYYHNGQACHGYQSADHYAATVVVKRVEVLPAFYWSANPYQSPAAPAPDATANKVLDALLLSQQQASQFQQQQNLMLLQALLLRQGGPAPALDPGQLTVPAIPQAAPLRAPAAPKKAGLEAFIEAHCIACHGSNGAKGNLDLSDLSKLSAERWADCWDAICDDTMPPKAKVTAAEKTAVKAEFRARIFARK